MSEKRDNYFDNAKFILIVFVVIGHFIETLTQGDNLHTIYRWIYSFHMPIFVFILGYFDRRSKNSNISNYIYWFFLFQTLYFAYYYFIDKSTSAIQFTSPQYSLWYIMACVAWKIITPRFIKLKHPIVYAFILCLLAGYDDTISATLSLSRIIVFYPFFLLGYFCNEEVISKIRKIPNYVSVSVLAGSYILCYFIPSIFPSFNLGLLLHYCSYTQMGYTVWYAFIYRFFSLSISIIVSIAVMAVIPKKQTFYTKHGRNTLQVYLIHGLIVRTLKTIGIHNVITQTGYKALFLLGTVLLAYFLSSDTFVLVTKPFFYPSMYLYKLLPNALIRAFYRSERTL